LMPEPAGTDGNVGVLPEAIRCTLAATLIRHRDSRVLLRFGSIFLSTGARQGDAGRLDIHAAFIQKSAIHSPRKVQ
jgi:hypothetical protein